MCCCDCRYQCRIWTALAFVVGCLVILLPTFSYHYTRHQCYMQALCHVEAVDVVSRACRPNGPPTCFTITWQVDFYVEWNATLRQNGTFAIPPPYVTAGQPSKTIAVVKNATSQNQVDDALAALPQESTQRCWASKYDPYTNGECTMPKRMPIVVFDEDGQRVFLALLLVALGVGAVLTPFVSLMEYYLGCATHICCRCGECGHTDIQRRQDNRRTCRRRCRSCWCYACDHCVDIGDLLGGPAQQNEAADDAEASETLSSTDDHGDSDDMHTNSTVDYGDSDDTHTDSTDDESDSDDASETAESGGDVERSTSSSVESSSATEDEEKACVICKDHKRSHLIRPCNHRILCRCCSDEKKLKTCPMCRTPIASIERVYG